MIGAVARARWRITWNAVRRPNAMQRRTRVRLIVIPLLLIVFASPLFVGIAAGVRYGTAHDPATVRHYLPLVFIGVFFLTLFGSFPTTLTALYFSPTVPLLLTAPVPLRTVFITALSESALAAPIVLLLSLALLIAYGIGAGAGIAFYLVAIVSILLTVLFVAALTQILVVGLLRIIPARRAREGLTLLGALLSIGAYAVWYGSRGGPGRLNGNGRFQTIADRFEPWSRWLPPGWAGRGSEAAQIGAWPAALGWLTLLALGTAVLGGAAYALFVRAFLVGWSATREAAPRQHGAARARVGIERFGVGWAPPVRAIAVKEFRTLVRDTKRLSVVVRSVGFMCVYLFFFLFRGGSPGTLQAGLWFWLRLLIAITALLFGLTSGVSGYSFGAEGTQFGLYRAAPLPPRSLFLGKWLAGVAIAAPVAVALTVGIGFWLHGSGGQLALLPLVALWYALGTSAIAVASAAIGPRFDAAQPNRATGAAGRLASAVASALFLAGSFVLWGGIALLTTAATNDDFGDFQRQKGLIGALVGVGALLAAGTVSAVCTTAMGRIRTLLAPAP
jgi:ABC-2 type transport system permease protein